MNPFRAPSAQRERQKSMPLLLVLLFISLIVVGSVSGLEPVSRMHKVVRRSQNDHSQHVAADANQRFAEHGSSSVAHFLHSNNKRALESEIEPESSAQPQGPPRRAMLLIEKDNVHYYAYSDAPDVWFRVPSLHESSLKNWFWDLKWRVELLGEKLKFRPFRRSRKAQAATEPSWPPRFELYTKDSDGQYFVSNPFISDEWTPVKSTLKQEGRLRSGIRRLKTALGSAVSKLHRRSEPGGQPTPNDPSASSSSASDPDTKPGAQDSKQQGASLSTVSQNEFLEAGRQAPGISSGQPARPRSIRIQTPDQVAGGSTSEIQPASDDETGASPAQQDAAARRGGLKTTSMFDAPNFDQARPQSRVAAWYDRTRTKLAAAAAKWKANLPSASLPRVFTSKSALLKLSTGKPSRTEPEAAGAVEAAAADPQDVRARGRYAFVHTSPGVTSASWFRSMDNEDRMGWVNDPVNPGGWVKIHSGPLQPGSGDEKLKPIAEPDGASTSETRPASSAPGSSGDQRQPPQSGASTSAAAGERTDAQPEPWRPKTMQLRYNSQGYFEKVSDPATPQVSRSPSLSSEASFKSTSGNKVGEEPDSPRGSSHESPDFKMPSSLSSPSSGGKTPEHEAAAAAAAESGRFGVSPKSSSLVDDAQARTVTAHVPHPLDNGAPDVNLQHPANQHIRDAIARLPERDGAEIVAFPNAAEPGGHVVYAYANEPHTAFHRERFNVLPTVVKFRQGREGPKAREMVVRPIPGTGQVEQLPPDATFRQAEFERPPPMSQADAWRWKLRTRLSDAKDALAVGRDRSLAGYHTTGGVPALYGWTGVDQGHIIPPEARRIAQQRGEVRIFYNPHSPLEQIRFTYDGPLRSPSDPLLPPTDAHFHTYEVPPSRALPLPKQWRDAGEAEDEREASALERMHKSQEGTWELPPHLRENYAIPPRTFPERWPDAWDRKRAEWAAKAKQLPQRTSDAWTRVKTWSSNLPQRVRDTSDRLRAWYAARPAGGAAGAASEPGTGRLANWRANLGQAWAKSPFSRRPSAAPTTDAALSDVQSAVDATAPSTTDATQRSNRWSSWRPFTRRPATEAAPSSWTQRFRSAADTLKSIPDRATALFKGTDAAGTTRTITEHAHPLRRRQLAHRRHRL
ncbi:uncharacterized protein SRS1_11226 [Sporisorium reilianum f. sp. reilianum]|uniref:WW domain-containing protein n=1 Tax=Sporisorium reilianum f. sp. reilianum TaxID=72559 RepID=A0A2N8UG94_9BASI|nr:uncharacterized protein SRS1_11226 [Sporisorium reilianum f. sp. reilianum]